MLRQHRRLSGALPEPSQIQPVSPNQQRQRAMLRGIQAQLDRDLDRLWRRAYRDFGVDQNHPSPEARSRVNTVVSELNRRQQQRMQEWQRERPPIQRPASFRPTPAAASVSNVAPGPTLQLEDHLPRSARGQFIREGQLIPGYRWRTK